MLLTYKGGPTAQRTLTHTSFVRSASPCTLQTHTHTHTHRRIHGLAHKALRRKGLGNHVGARSLQHIFVYNKRPVKNYNKIIRGFREINNAFYKFYGYHKYHLPDASYFIFTKFLFVSRGLFSRNYNCDGLYIIYVKNYQAV